MGDGVGVPALGEHRDRDHAADVGAQAALLADGIHDLAQQVLVAEVVGLAGVAGALDNLAAEAGDLVGGHGAEVGVQGLAGFQLLAVDEQGARARQGVAVFVVVAKQGQAALFRLAGAIGVLALEAGDVVVHQFGGGGVVAHHDEAGGHGDAGLLPEGKGLFVVAVEGLEGGLELGRQVEGVEGGGLAPALLGHLGADVFPEVAEHRHLGAGDVVGDGHAGQFDDAALDGVHEGEVAHGPGEQGAFGVAGAAQEEGGGGEVDDPRQAQAAVDGLQPGDPQAGGGVVLLGLLLVFALEGGLLVVLGLFTVAVVGLVVDRQDLLQAHEVGHDPLQHLAGGLLGVEGLAPAALEELAVALGDIQALAAAKGVVVGDDDLGALDRVQQVGGDQFAAGVVAVGVVGLEDAQPVLDGDAGGDDEEAPGEAFAIAVAVGVDDLPGDEHGHDGGLAGAGGELEGQALQIGVGVAVGGLEMVEKALPGLAELGGDLGEPDEGLDRLDLTEKGAVGAEGVVAPVLEQAGGFRVDPPQVGRELPPLVDLLAEGVDDGGVVVLLGAGAEAVALIEGEFTLLATALLFLGLGDRGDEFRPAPGVDDALGGLAAGVEFPVAVGIGVGGIEDRLVEEGVAHGLVLTRVPWVRKDGGPDTAGQRPPTSLWVSGSTLNTVSVGVSGYFTACRG